MNVYCIVNQTMRLSGTTRKIQLREPLAYSNQRAHAFRVTVLAEDSDDPADLTGIGVTGQFMKLATNQTVFPINGTVTGNVAEVILPTSCYVTPGRYRFTLDLAKAASTDGVPAFDATATYAKGDWVVYSGAVYAFTAAHTGAWTGNDAVAVNDTRTALWVEGFVERNTTDEIIDPGEPIPNIQQAISAANSAAALANSAATEASTAAAAAEAIVENWSVGTVAEIKAYLNIP